MIIAIDFDGTLCEHCWPHIGPEVPFAISWCKRFQEMGAELILLTMRSSLLQPDYVGKEYTLGHAVEWCRARGLEFWSVNHNPQQSSWSSSAKVYAHLYIDDAALGVPLIHHQEKSRRPYVDWARVGPTVTHLIANRRG